MGGFTQQVRNPDSWEGWYWGSKHVWGKGLIGMMSPADNIVKDISENSDMVVVWGGDPETTTWGFRGQFASRLLFFWSEIGIKQVYINPDLNYAAAIHADKWIPVLPNTDAALQLALMHVWITEGTYDAAYLDTHAVGFDKMKAYVLGEEDGIAKTPKWASAKCGVPPWTIKALARDWAKKAVTIGHYFGGGMARGPYSTEPARLEVVLLGMQGLGKPGVHQAQIAYTGMPKNVITGGADHMGPFANLTATPAGDRLLKPHKGTPTAWGKQMVPKTLIEDAIKNGKVDFWGTGGHEELTSNQYQKYTYPIPKEEGGTEFHMMWTDSPCRTTCWNCGNDVVEATRDPKIEFVLAQHPWLENDCIYADIVLPVSTTLEVDDISPCIREGDSFQSVILMRQAVAPVGESKSDYEAVVEIAKKLGMEEAVTEGFSVDDLIEATYKGMKFDAVVDWDEFQEKDYCVLPVAPDWEKWPAGLYEFYMDPEGHPLPTPSGKLEFYSESLAKAFPDRRRAAAVPAVDREGHHARRADLEQEGAGLSAAGDVQPRPLARARPVRRHPVDQRGADRQGQGLRRLPVRAVLDAPVGRRGTGHQGRRHRPGLQRARRRAVRRARVGADRAWSHLHRPRRAGGLHQLLAARPRRRDQHHRAGGARVQARRRSGHQRVPRRGGAGLHGA